MDVKTWQGTEITIKVDYDRCSGKGECADGCPSAVYELQSDKTVPVNIDACIACCACVSTCPEIAIDHSAC
jgi:NAD-dependent dihydropyrimidine dehydrogenase PreA subunit